MSSPTPPLLLILLACFAMSVMVAMGRSNPIVKEGPSIGKRSGSFGASSRGRRILRRVSAMPTSGVQRNAEGTNKASRKALTVAAAGGLAMQLASSSGGAGPNAFFPSFADMSGAGAGVMAPLFNTTVSEKFGAIIPGDSPFEVVATSGLYNFLNYYNFAIVVRLLLTWFPNPPQALVGPLAAICDPYLNIFRGIIPPLGQLDLSPIISLGLLNFITGATAALPCELQKRHDARAVQSEQLQEDASIDAPVVPRITHIEQN